MESSAVPARDARASSLLRVLHAIPETSSGRQEEVSGMACRTRNKLDARASLAGTAELSIHSLPFRVQPGCSSAYAHVDGAVHLRHSQRNCRRYLAALSSARDYDSRANGDGLRARSPCRFAV